MAFVKLFCQLLGHPFTMILKFSAFNCVNENDTSYMIVIILLSVNLYPSSFFVQSLLLHEFDSTNKHSFTSMTTIKKVASDHAIQSGLPCYTMKNERVILILGSVESSVPFKTSNDRRNG